MSALRILPLGKGNAFTRTDFPTSFIICADDETLLFDCPSPLRRIFFEAETRSGLPLDIDQIDHIFLSHLHADHSNGLEEIGYYKTKIVNHDPPNLYLLQENLKPVWDGKLKAAMGYGDESRNLNTFFDPFPLEANQLYNLTLKNGEATFKIYRTIHSLPCYAMVFEYKGSKVGFSADTEFDRGVIDFISEADVIIHDANNSSNHTFVHELETLSDELKNKIYLTHLSDDFEPSSTKMKVAEPGIFITISR